MDNQTALFEFLCRTGDNTLVLGHRLSEWCGMAPALEEDIALANVALDLIGQTQMWLGLAGEIEGKGRSADDLAMLRDATDFRNLLLVERPNEDYGHTLMRQFFFDTWHLALLETLQTSSNIQVAEIAAKSIKEVRYHVTRSTETVIALGDGSEESHRRMQDALEVVWPYVGEMFHDDDVDDAIAEAGIAPLPSTLKESCFAKFRSVIEQATLQQPASEFAHKGGKSGFRHTEHLGHMLAQMQHLQRAYPGLNW
ncbi:1,2-phenylacetyl-CoA epoxidase subunit PaaC [uncultured Ruegeria sp.]|uniref:1,2-phenylacetyl-CoA epoxidase subunit PaaC n=1 Tax=uncultured Ruegeria sp. TaxID=259304 RepID=UPI0026049784|nr:1,2-phenylacetyl-CoA epoxidase subunit PaaC [uncultured Ruegeria sp.]